MANRGPHYGLSRQCHQKTLAKFDLARAKEACSWVEQVVGTQLVPSSYDFKDQYDVKMALRDGQTLCRLIDILNPGRIRKINKSKLAFKEMENIEQFVNACRDYGMKEVDTFQTQDLYEAKSMYSVVNCLYSLGSLAQKNGYGGPTLGVKLAVQNERRFSQETMIAGRMVVNLQYGSNKGASQKGMTPYGSIRKM